MQLRKRYSMSEVNPEIPVSRTEGDDVDIEPLGKKLFTLGEKLENARLKWEEALSDKSK